MTVSDSLVTDVRLKTAYLYPQNKRFLWLFTASGNLLTIRIKSCPVNCLLLVWIVCLMVCSSKFTFIKTTFYQVWGQLQYYSWSSVCFTGSVLAFMIVLNWIQSFTTYSTTNNLSSSISIKISCVLKSIMCILCIVCSGNCMHTYKGWKIYGFADRI